MPTRGNPLAGCVRLACVLIALGLAACPAASGQQERLPVVEPAELLVDTVFQADRLAEHRNNAMALNYFRCNCRGMLDYDGLLAAPARPIRAANIALYVQDIEGRSYAFQTFRNTGSFDGLFRALGIGFDVVDDIRQANWVIDYRASGSERFAREEPVFRRGSCAVFEDEGVHTLTIDGEATLGDEEYSDAAQCIAHSILGVLGFSALLPQGAWNVDVSNPPDREIRIIYSRNRSGLMRSTTTDCALILYRLLPDGLTESDSYFNSLRRVEQRASAFGRQQCFPTRALVLIQSNERR